jgi:hypothetical protein
MLKKCQNNLRYNMNSYFKRIDKSNRNIYVLITDISNRKTFDLYNIINRKYPNLKCILTFHKWNIVSRSQFKVAYLNKIHRLRKDSYDHFECDFLKILNLCRQYDLKQEGVWLPQSYWPRIEGL